MGSDPIPPWDNVEVGRARLTDLQDKLTDIKQAFVASGERGYFEKNAQLRLLYVQALERLAHSVTAMLKEANR